ncbi:MAG: hypothetical protein UY09_C0017G0007 [Parcubacteria group bacterium GW2011_GWA2_47_8]|nr:MAG: hypothetical protein UY09_C0017G0007 [Parcubacteria group bacterium GW2011_GWA2_47_8]OHB18240.1 MAG: hypothetical protein A2666_00835 [Parcubacteria group bacterium RIFCSPHIGHO2_01_FULL_47_10b]
MQFFERDNSDILHQLRSLERVKPDGAWTRSTRAQLFALAEYEGLAAPRHPFLFSKMVLAPALVVLAVVMIIGGSVAFAAQSAKPDDLLYPVKLATEKIQETIAPTQRAKLELQQKFVERRYQELAVLKYELTLEGRDVDEIKKAISRNKKAAESLLIKMETAVPDSSLGGLLVFDGVLATSTLVASTATTSTTTAAIINLKAEGVDVATAVILERIDAQIKEHRDLLEEVSMLTNEIPTGTTTMTTATSTPTSTPVGIIPIITVPEQATTTTVVASSVTSTSTPAVTAPQNPSITIQTETTTNSTAETN